MTHSTSQTQADRTPPRFRLRNSLKQASVILVWAICFVVVSQALKRQLVPDGPMQWLIACLPTIAALLLVDYHRRYLRTMDELHRLIELESLALAFGAVFVAITGYRVFERVGAPSAELSHFIAVGALAYMVATVYNWNRYR